MPRYEVYVRGRLISTETFFCSVKVDAANEEEAIVLARELAEEDRVDWIPDQNDPGEGEIDVTDVQVEGEISEG